MRNVLAFVLLGSMLVACLRNKDEEVMSAESALDSADSVHAEGNLMMANVDGADMAGVTALTGEEVAIRIAANIGLRWPSSCRTITTNGASITITYNDCTGPRGLVHVSGQLVLTVSVRLDGTIIVHGTSGNLSVNDAHLVVDVDAAYSISGTNHTLAITTNGSSTGPRGNELDHVGEYTIAWDSASQCGSLSGSWATEATIDGRTATRTTSVDLQKCLGSCPIGTIDRTYRTGATLTVTFDGTATAEWQTSTGRAGTITLQCR